MAGETQLALELESREPADEEFVEWLAEVEAKLRKSEVSVQRARDLECLRAAFGPRRRDR